MTTIAANRKEMAGDQKTTHGEQRFRAGKIWRVGQSIIGGAGEDEHIASIIQWLSDGFKQKKAPAFKKDDEFDVLVLTPAGLFLFGSGIHPIEIKDDFYAIGTGAPAALAAMHMGASPKRAVEIACKVDNSTDGPVDVLTLGKLLAD